MHKAIIWHLKHKKMPRRDLAAPHHHCTCAQRAVEHAVAAHLSRPSAPSRRSLLQHDWIELPQSPANAAWQRSNGNPPGCCGPSVSPAGSASNPSVHHLRKRSELYDSIECTWCNWKLWTHLSPNHCLPPTVRIRLEGNSLHILKDNKSSSSIDLVGYSVESFVAPGCTESTVALQNVCRSQMNMCNDLPIRSSIGHAATCTPCWLVACSCTDGQPPSPLGGQLRGCTRRGSVLIE